MGNATDETRVARRETIIQAASDLFATHDFAKVQMDQVAEKARVAKGTVYNYFESKDQLYLSIMKIRLNNLLLLLEEAFDKREDAQKNLRSFLSHFYGFMLKHPSFYLIWKKEQWRLNSDSKEEIHIIKDKIQGLLEKVLKVGIRKGTFKKGHAPSVAGFILGILDAAIYRGLADGITAQDCRREREAVHRFILRGIKL
jgi:AcrR family transcriptional regulator